MGDEADDIMTGFALTGEEKRDYDVVKTKFDGHFVMDVGRKKVKVWTALSFRSTAQRIWHYERRNDSSTHRYN